jgi:PPOX class probable FMN-dependent enzyme
MVEAPARRFTEVVASEDELRALLGHPSALARDKAQSRLDAHCRAFIAMSPFLLLGTADADVHCDVSPRGDAPGFCLVLDEQTLVIPDRPGNKRFDSLSNILAHGAVGLLFMIPTIEETLRVNGRAQIVRDPDLLARLEARGKVPQLAIVVEVEEAFIHCAKSLKRSQLWEPAGWPDGAALTSRAQMFIDHAGVTGVSVEALEASLAESYKKNLY